MSVPRFSGAAAVLLLALVTAPAGLRAQVAAAKDAPGVLPLQHAARPTVKAITAADLMTRLYILVDDSMLGRQIGTPGNVKATDYIAAEVRRLGLVPAGEGGSYFQAIPLVQLRPDTLAALSAGGTPLGRGRDYVALPGAPVLPFANSFHSAGMAVVYGGVAGDTAQALAPQRFAGRLLVFAPPLVGGRPSFQFWTTLPALRRYMGAAGIAFATLDLTPAALLDFVATPSFMDEGGGAPPGAPVGLLVGNALVERLFGKPLAQLQVGDTGAVLTGAVDWVRTPAQYPARNVVALLPGSDPKLKGEYVALGAHSDHIGTGKPVLHDSLAAFNRVLRPGGMENADTPEPTAEQWARVNAVKDSLRRLWPERRDSVFNGADDDGSGSVALLEIAEKLAAGRHPRRSVLFVWHTGEEAGLYGSRWFTGHPTVPRDSIVAEVNTDMIGRGEARGEGGLQGDVAVIGAGRLSTELNHLVGRAAARDGMVLDRRYDVPGEPHQFYCRADHYSYARFGIPSVVFSTMLQPDYHQLTDEAEYIDYPHMARIANYLAALTVDLADLDHRPVVDGHKPASPDEPCRP